MDKYLVIVLVMLVMGMIFSIVKSPPNIILFYAQMAGAIGVIMYASYRNRKNYQNKKRKRL